MHSMLMVGVLCSIVSPLCGMQKWQNLIEKSKKHKRIGLITARSYEETYEPILVGKGALIQGANELRTLAEELLEQEGVGLKMVHELIKLINQENIPYNQKYLNQIGSLLVFAQNQVLKEVDKDAQIQLEYYADQLDLRIKSEKERLQKRELHRSESTEESPRKTILRKISSHLSPRKKSSSDEEDYLIPF